MYKTILMTLVLAATITATASPKATRDSILQVITGAAMPAQTYDILRFGARGDGKKDCKPAFDKAMKMAARKGGAHIVVPSGTYLLNGPIHLVDNVCLDLKEGAVLYCSENSKSIVNCLLAVEKAIKLRRQELVMLDQLIKARFVELFGDPAVIRWGIAKTTIREGC